jgi:flagellar hook-associated protein 3 FlgL
VTTIGRVTHATMRNSTLTNLQANMKQMSLLEAQMSSGVKIGVASDDPGGAADVLRIKKEQAQLAQYDRNASDGEAWLLTVDAALTTSLTALTKARTLTVNGGNGALGDASRIALAEEIDGLKDSLLQQANTTYLGRSVFAGTTSGEAFGDADDPAGAYSFKGIDTASVTRTVASGTSVRVDSTGSAIFGDGDDSVFKLLDDISATLRAGGDPVDQLDAIDGFLDKMKTELASVGARENQIDSAQDLIASKVVTSKSQLSAVQDIDLAQIILDIQSQEVAYQGALGAAAKVLQPTLLDFLS